MRILTTLTFYVPHWTGLTTYARHIAEGLAARGHDVSVLTAHHARDLPRREDVGGVAVHRIPVAGRISRTMVMPTYPLALWRAVGRSDVVHVHTPMPEAALVVLVARLRRRAVVMTHQGDVVMPAGAANRVIETLMTAVLRTAARHADAVSTHSEGYARHSRVLTHRRRPVTSISPPTTLPEREPGAAAEWRRELGLEGAPVVGFAGRFVEEKGFDVLLDAVPAVLREIPDARFVFAGETDVVYEDHYERCRATHGAVFDADPPVVRSVGLLLDRRRLAAFYAMCDVFVLPSRSDCFAAVQVEALIAGTRVVASDIPGAGDVVRETGQGRLVPPNDPAALAAALVDELRSTPPPFDHAGIARRFDADAAITAYEDLLAGAITSAGSRRRWLGRWRGRAGHARPG